MFRKAFSLLVILVILSSLLAQGSISSADTYDYTVNVWNVAEITLNSTVSYEEPFYDVSATGVFTLRGTSTTITRPAFWDGGNVWKIRFAPTQMGVWDYTISCSDSNNTGLTDGGSILSTAYEGGLPIYQNGFVKPDSSGRYFTYQNGTPFFWLSEDHSFVHEEKWDESSKPGMTSQFKDTAEKRIQQGFTVYQTYALTGYQAGVRDIDNSRVFGSTGWYRELDKRMEYIASKGLVSDISLGGFYTLWSYNNNTNVKFSEFTTPDTLIGLSGGINFNQEWKSKGHTICIKSRAAYIDSTSATQITRNITLPSQKKFIQVTIGSLSGSTEVTLHSAGNTDKTVTVDAGTTADVRPDWSNASETVQISVTNSTGANNAIFDDFIYCDEAFSEDYTAFKQEEAKQAEYCLARYGAYPAVWSFVGEPGHYVGWTGGSPAGDILTQTRFDDRLDAWKYAEEQFYNKNSIGYNQPQSVWYENRINNDDGLPKGNTPWPAYWINETWHTFIAQQACHELDVYHIDAPSKKYWYYYTNPATPQPILDSGSAWERLHNNDAGNSREVQSSDVRKAAYRAIQYGACGYTYGAQGVWDATYDDTKSNNGEFFYGHLSWPNGVDLPGADQMTHLKSFYTDDGFEWWELEPRYNFSDADYGSITDWSNEPDDLDMPAVKSSADNFYAAIYYPQESGAITGTIYLQANTAYELKWFNPRTGIWNASAIASTNGSGALELQAKPDGYDWALRIQKAKEALHWKMDESSGISMSDASGNNLTGTLVQGAAFVAGGQSGNAVSFNGTTAYGAIADTPGLDGMSELTVSVWVNMDQLPSSGSYYTPIGKDTNDYSYRIVIDSAGTPSFAVKTDNNEWYTAGTSIASDKKTGINGWHNIVGTYDGNNVHIFVDGEWRATNSTVISGRIHESPSYLCLGYPSSGLYFKGKMDEARIFKDALTPTQVQEMYRSTGTKAQQAFPSPDPGDPAVAASLQGYWKLDESTGTSAADSSGNNNTGSLIGGASFASGRLGNAVALNGTTGYVDIPDSTSFSDMSGLTVSAWINMAALPAQDKIYVPVGKDTDGYSFRLAIDSTGQLHFVVSTNNNSLYTDGTLASSQFLHMVTNRWYHIVGMYDGSKIKFYVNGVLFGTAARSISGNISNSASDVKLGQGDGASVSYFNGMIDDVRIYNTGLSSARVIQLYALKAWEFNNDGDKEGWYAANNITGDAVSGGHYGGTITSTDPFIISADNLNLDIQSGQVVKIRMKNSTSSTLGEVYFITDTDTTWDSAKHKDFTIFAQDKYYTEYIIDMSDVTGWTGKLKRLRIDPEHGAASGTFSIDYIRIESKN